MAEGSHQQGFGGPQGCDLEGYDAQRPAPGIPGVVNIMHPCSQAGFCMQVALSTWVIGSVSHIKGCCKALSRRQAGNWSEKGSN